MDILSIVMTLAALVALSSPIWVGFVAKPEPESYSDRLETTIDFIHREQDDAVLEQLLIYTECRRMLLHIDHAEGLARLG